MGRLPHIRRVVVINKSKADNGKPWWLEKIVAPIFVGAFLGGLGLVTSYQLFVVQAKHSEKMLGYSDGHYYATKYLTAMIEKRGPHNEFERFCENLLPAFIHKRNRERPDLISAAQLTWGSLIFEHWELIRNNEGVHDITVALREIDEGLRRSPEKVQLYWLRGLARFQLEQYDWAALDFQYVLKKWPHYVKAGLAMASAYCKLHLYKKALAVLKKFNDNGWQTVAGYNALGNIYFHQAQYLLHEYPKRNVDNYYRKAITNYAMAIKMNPEYAFAYNNRGWVYYTWKKHQLAIKDFKQAIQLNPDLTVAYYNRGLYYSKCSKYDEAIYDFTEAIQRNPDLVIAYHNRGWAYLNKANGKPLWQAHFDYGGAILDLSIAICLEDDGKAHCIRGKAFSKLGLMAQARADFQRARELDCDCPNEPTD